QIIDDDALQVSAHLVNHVENQVVRQRPGGLLLMQRSVEGIHFMKPDEDWELPPPDRLAENNDLRAGHLGCLNFPQAHFDQRNLRHDFSFKTAIHLRSESIGLSNYRYPVNGLVTWWMIFSHPSVKKSRRCDSMTKTTTAIVENG